MTTDTQWQAWGIRKRAGVQRVFSNFVDHGSVLVAFMFFQKAPQAS